MLDKILKIINENPKHYSKMIKNNAEMLNWIHENKLVDSDNLSVILYCMIHNVNSKCAYGKEKKFNTISKGFKNCGNASECQCAREQVSQAVKQSKSKITESQQKTINEKREKTNLEKYGVKNIGQTDIAKKIINSFT
jgi:hypothetical protein